MYEDPDFGPVKDDPHGTKSLYFKEQPVGLPDSRNVFWVRPKELSEVVNFYNENLS